MSGDRYPTSSIMTGIEPILNALTTLAAAFAGAWAAFRLENRRRRKETVNQQVGATNRALYTLFNMWNVLSQYQREVINEYRGKPDQWLNMVATTRREYGQLSFDAAELSFLLQTSDVNIFAEVMLEEQRCQTVIRLIDHRSSIVLGEVFPRLSNAGVRVGENRPRGEIETILGISIIHQLKELTKSITQLTGENIKSLEGTFDHLRAAALRIHPQQKFIKVDFGKKKEAA
jgi:hypothetical protein